MRRGKAVSERVRKSSGGQGDLGMGEIGGGGGGGRREV